MLYELILFHSIPLPMYAQLVYHKLFFPQNIQGEFSRQYGRYSQSVLKIVLVKDCLIFYLNTWQEITRMFCERSIDPLQIGSQKSRDLRVAQKFLVKASDGSIVSLCSEMFELHFQKKKNRMFCEGGTVRKYVTFKGCCHGSCQGEGWQHIFLSKCLTS